MQGNEKNVADHDRGDVVPDAEKETLKKHRKAQRIEIRIIKEQKKQPAYKIDRQQQTGSAQKQEKII
jgi:hypothetical protein